MGKVEHRISLADFLTDLRAELHEAQARSTQDSLKLGVEEITLTLEVTHTLSRQGDASGRLQAKFWVLGSAGADVKGSVASERARTQQLTLTLKPRIEQVVIDEQGRQRTLSQGVDVDGSLVADEQQPPVPYAEEH
jgi:hypothetical protein